MAQESQELLEILRQIARSCACPEEIKMLQIRMGVPQPKRTPPPKRTINLQNLAAAVGTVSAVTVPPKRAMPEAALGVAEADAAAPPPPKKRPPPKRANKATDEAVAARTAAEPVEAESPAVKTKRQPPPKKPKAEGRMLGSESATVESASSAELASATVESFESTTLEETLPLLPKKKPPPRRSQS
jgi:hypothetical protein